MINALIKLAAFCFMGIVTVGGTHALLNVESTWGRYTFNAAVPAGTAITVSHPHSEDPALAPLKQNAKLKIDFKGFRKGPTMTVSQIVHVETVVPLTGEQTIDVGSFSTLGGFYVVAMLTGYVLRGRRRQFINE